MGRVCQGKATHQGSLIWVGHGHGPFYANVNAIQPACERRGFYSCCVNVFDVVVVSGVLA